MANRAVKQPNGLYARFSDVVDGFTHINFSREDMLKIFGDEMGPFEAGLKLERADTSPDRFDEAIAAVACIHGTAEARRCREEMVAVEPSTSDGSEAQSEAGANAGSAKGGDGRSE